MSDLHEHESRGSSLSTLILLAVIILGLLYFLAKGCTNHSEDETAPSSHGTAMIVSSQQLLIPA